MWIRYDLWGWVGVWMGEYGWWLWDGWLMGFGGDFWKLGWVGRGMDDRKLWV